eukprot:CAMPEP_0194131272 /NCGR_PEP_ID=MMETSP0152-20130528/2081_1 /TAXON_ID=1049557 /ORGANISM="Thalassiothrix antarctica, Strain L6-D1" /LENGTH=100 /DNA_ID=CAMNT_0038826003 /DNA_START=36 /DNA_END=338 /DNA_ORIENTATION=-
MKIATNTTLLSLVALPAFAFLISPVSAGCRYGTYHRDNYSSFWTCQYNCGGDCHRQAWNDFKCCEGRKGMENELNIDKVLDKLNEELDNIDKKLNNNKFI